LLIGESNPNNVAICPAFATNLLILRQSIYHLRMNRTRLALAIIVLLILAGALVLFSTRTSMPNTKMQVTATFYPLYEFARQVGGDKIDVTNATPAGAEPHDYEPTPKQLVAAQKAGVFIYNGASFEPWVEKFLPEYTGTRVAGSDGIALRAEGATHDPHYWLDPVLAQKTVNTIRDGLGKADPGNATYYTQQAAEYNAKLAKLDTDIKHGLASCKKRTVVTSHDAFGYFAARYNVEVAPIAGLSPTEEPSAAKLAELSGLVKREGLTHIFFESLVSPRLAETLASETGAKTAVFDTIEGIPYEEQQQGKDYIHVQRENLRSLRQALACE
jgi:zinc transport system substrate-binding protein